ncbi:MerR family transcriptional regulator [Allopontixanthobacter sp.]|uniref:MerR family transcriptional regulator n=1 Tax=Allopontixanthobacter sp. TaxID=2906452 RepID=UPI002ABC5D47|nr:MerR family transcriptional regulator [Allopontixanthobacter sp.]MDZ4307737.1 MerR family transcriptional regulator [Allopontixanthobacter sp.]
MSARFTDGKDERALRTIGEVSAALGIKSHVLRYWEQQFPSLHPLKRSGRRYYRPEDITLLETIDKLVNREGYTLKGAQQVLKDVHRAPPPPGLDPGHVAAELAPEVSSAESGTNPPADVPAEVIARLKSIRSTLARALEA